MPEITSKIAIFAFNTVQCIQVQQRLVKRGFIHPYTNENYNSEVKTRKNKPTQQNKHTQNEKIKFNQAS